MDKFSEFDAEVGPTLEFAVPGGLCTKITLHFVNPEGAVAVVGFVREGFTDPDENDKLQEVDPDGDLIYPEDMNPEEGEED